MTEIASAAVKAPDNMAMIILASVLAGMILGFIMGCFWGGRAGGEDDQDSE